MSLMMPTDGLPLSDLFDALSKPRWLDKAAVGCAYIQDITSDSRQVRTGSLFVALPGTDQHGIAYLSQAIASGAVAAVIPEDMEHKIPDSVGEKCSVILVADIREAAGQLAARFWAKKPEYLLAVTGTNGKSSVVHFARQLLEAVGIPACSIGTLGVFGPGEYQSDAAQDGTHSLTTPDVFTIHRLLAHAAERGAKAGVLEASSHGLDQGRLAGLEFDAAALTHIAQDHLDYHGTMEAYRKAKMLLFSRYMKETGRAIFQADTIEEAEIIKSIGRNNYQAWAFDTPEIMEHGQRTTLKIGGQVFQAETDLIGVFQWENIVCALGLAASCGVSLQQLVPQVKHLQPVMGRMQVVATGEGGGPMVLVDYAHTADGLEAALMALRPYAEIRKGRIWVVFGCGGNRDTGKRPKMGAVAQEFADRIVVTDDNPREENAATIRGQILAACPGAEELADREVAIGHAIASMARQDVLLIAGKGHETYQIIGTTRRPWNDTAIVQEALEKNWNKL